MGRDSRRRSMRVLFALASLLARTDAACRGLLADGATPSPVAALGTGTAPPTVSSRCIDLGSPAPTVLSDSPAVTSAPTSLVDETLAPTDVDEAPTPSTEAGTPAPNSGEGEEGADGNTVADEASGAARGLDFGFSGTGCTFAFVAVFSAVVASAAVSV